MTFGIGYGHQRLADVADGENMQSFMDEPGGAARIPGRNKSRHLGTLADQGDGQVAGGGATGQNDDMGPAPPFCGRTFMPAGCAMEHFSAIDAGLRAPFRHIFEVAGNRPATSGKRLGTG